ncbi:unnamed protein product [Anisakis simplex]|uniref:Uncharacterized protein n=1 Tax=Anisakis simplex TaxID=6269 RepID=A0A0M3JLB5_ANISI|nr:unnamed protein product [Anisakis simplex]
MLYCLVDLDSRRVQLSYLHYASNNKLRLVVQLHPNYANNHRICVEIVEGESSLNREQAIELLEVRVGRGERGEVGAGACVCVGGGGACDSAR